MNGIMLLRKPSKQTINHELLTSVQQLCTILKDEGQPWETNIIMSNGWAIAHNNVIGIGEKIKEDINCCPHAFTLRDALSKCGQSINITQLDTKLSIKSDKFRALVKCIPRENMTLREPDAPVVPIDDRLKASVVAVSKFTEDETRIDVASILLHNGSVVAGDRHVYLEHWHGIDLPPNLALPKAVIQPLIKNTKKLTQFGYSNNSVTFWYEDGSWLKTQLFVEKWPDVQRIFNRPSNPLPLPEGFFAALRTVEPFSESACVYFDTNALRSHPPEFDAGATYEVYGLPKGPIMNIKQLRMMEPFIKTIDFFVQNGNHKMTLFFGDNCRGVIAGRTS